METRFIDDNGVLQVSDDGDLKLEAIDFSERVEPYDLGCYDDVAPVPQGRRYLYAFYSPAPGEMWGLKAALADQTRAQAERRLHDAFRVAMAARNYRAKRGTARQ